MNCEMSSIQRRSVVPQGNEIVSIRHLATRESLLRSAADEATMGATKAAGHGAYLKMARRYQRGSLVLVTLKDGTEIWEGAASEMKCTFLMAGSAVRIAGFR
jgi:hypothetical protein